MMVSGEAGPQAVTVVIGRDVEVTDSFRAHAMQRLAGLAGLEDRAVTYTIEVFHEKNPRQAKVGRRVEIAITGPGPTMRAEGSGPDIYVALAAALTKLHARQRRIRDRRRVRRQPSPGVTTLPVFHGHEPDGTPVLSPGRDRDSTPPGARFRLPRSSPDLAADLRAAEAAERAADTDGQRAAVRLRMESLAERQRAEVT